MDMHAGQKIGHLNEDLAPSHIINLVKFNLHSHMQLTGHNGATAHH